MESLGALLPFVIILLAFWLLIIRPSRTRARQQAQLQSDLAPGQEVMTTSGLFATVAAVEDNAIILETSPGVRTRWTKAAVGRVVTRDSDPVPDAVSDPASDSDPHTEAAPGETTAGSTDAASTDQPKRLT